MTSALCAHCSALQPFPASPPSYFEVFGLKPLLELNENILRSKFYDLSKKTHPDSFVLSHSANQIHATRWSTLINRAYQTLKSPFSRAEYLLELFADTSPIQRSLPTELAESYFELQDMLTTGQGKQALESFIHQLDKEEEGCQKEWALLADEWSQSDTPQVLVSRLRSCVDKHKYLASLRQNIEKHRGVL